LRSCHFHQACSASRLQQNTFRLSLDPVQSMSRHLSERYFFLSATRITFTSTPSHRHSRPVLDTIISGELSVDRQLSSIRSKTKTQTLTAIAVGGNSRNPSHGCHSNSISLCLSQLSSTSFKFDIQDNTKSLIESLDDFPEIPSERDRQDQSDHQTKAIQKPKW
jgi:hypothetical protein